jgi:hypothetical protein
VNIRLSRGHRDGALATECVIALAILVTAVIPLSLGFLQEIKVCRAYYYRGAAMEVVDGEMEVLLAGEKERFALGEHDYRPQGRVVTNLPPGKFTLIVRTDALRLDWQPLLHQTGGKVSREVQIR